MVGHIRELNTTNRVEENSERNHQIFQLFELKDNLLRNDNVELNDQEKFIFLDENIPKDALRIKANTVARESLEELAEPILADCIADYIESKGEHEGEKFVQAYITKMSSFFVEDTCLYFKEQVQEVLSFFGEDKEQSYKDFYKSRIEPKFALLLKETKGGQDFVHQIEQAIEDSQKIELPDATFPLTILKNAVGAEDEQQALQAKMKSSRVVLFPLATSYHVEENNVPTLIELANQCDAIKEKNKNNETYKKYLVEAKGVEKYKNPQEKFVNSLKFLCQDVASKEKPSQGGFVYAHEAFVNVRAAALKIKSEEIQNCYNLVMQKQDVKIKGDEDQVAKNNLLKTLQEKIKDPVFLIDDEKRAKPRNLTAVAYELFGGEKNHEVAKKIAQNLCERRIFALEEGGEEKVRISSDNPEVIEKSREDKWITKQLAQAVLYAKRKAENIFGEIEIDLGDVRSYLDIAIEVGGVGNKEREFKEELFKLVSPKYEHEVEVEVENHFKVAKKISKYFQEYCNKSSLLTGRDYGVDKTPVDLVGMRTSRIDPRTIESIMKRVRHFERKKRIIEQRHDHSPEEQGRYFNAQVRAEGSLNDRRNPRFDNGRSGGRGIGEIYDRQSTEFTSEMNRREAQVFGRSIYNPSGRSNFHHYDEEATFADEKVRRHAKAKRRHQKEDESHDKQPFFRNDTRSNQHRNSPNNNRRRSEFNDSNGQYSWQGQPYIVKNPIYGELSSQRERMPLLDSPTVSEGRGSFNNRQLLEDGVVGGYQNYSKPIYAAVRKNKIQETLSQVNNDSTMPSLDNLDHYEDLNQFQSEGGNPPPDLPPRRPKAQENQEFNDTEAFEEYQVGGVNGGHSNDVIEVDNDIATASNLASVNKQLNNRRNRLGAAFSRITSAFAALPRRAASVMPFKKGRDNSASGTDIAQNNKRKKRGIFNKFFKAKGSYEIAKDTDEVGLENFLIEEGSDDVSEVREAGNEQGASGLDRADNGTENGNGSAVKGGFMYETEIAGRQGNAVVNSDTRNSSSINNRANGSEAPPPKPFRKRRNGGVSPVNNNKNNSSNATTAETTADVNKVAVGNNQGRETFGRYSGKKMLSDSFFDSTEEDDFNNNTSQLSSDNLQLASRSSSPALSTSSTQQSEGLSTNNSIGLNTGTTTTTTTATANNQSNNNLSRSESLASVASQEDHEHTGEPSSVLSRTNSAESLQEEALKEASTIQSSWF